MCVCVCVSVACMVCVACVCVCVACVCVCVWHVCGMCVTSSGENLEVHIQPQVGNEATKTHLTWRYAV